MPTLTTQFLCLVVWEEIIDSSVQLVSWNRALDLERKEDQGIEGLWEEQMLKE